MALGCESCGAAAWEFVAVTKNGRDANVRLCAACRAAEPTRSAKQ